MVQEKENPNPTYIPAELVEDILLKQPLSLILKFKTVSKQWRSILESKSFAERRKSVVVQKNPIILADGESRFQGDTEIDIVNLQRPDGTTPRLSLTCNGLVCISVPNWVHVLNPSTGEFLRFPSALYGIEPFEVRCKWELFPDYWAMGFGRDEVKGSYKVVRLLFRFDIFEILDVNIGEWRKLSPPPYKIEASRKKSACVNGSIYWLDLNQRFHILALDLHTEEFRDLSVILPPPHTHMATAMLVNLEDRLAMAYTCISHEWKLKIWSMDAQEETWTRTYSISLSGRVISPIVMGRWFTPMVVSLQGNLFFYDNDNRVFKYDPKTDYLSCLSQDICVLTPFVENFVPLRLQGGGCVPQKISTSSYRYQLSCPQSQPGSVSRISTFVTWTELLNPNILLTSTLLSLVIFGYRYKYCS